MKTKEKELELFRKNLLATELDSILPKAKEHSLAWYNEMMAITTDGYLCDGVYITKDDGLEDGLQTELINLHIDQINYLDKEYGELKEEDLYYCDDVYSIVFEVAEHFLKQCDI